MHRKPGTRLLPCAAHLPWQVPGAASDPDAAVLSSRLEVMAAQLERERAEHKRELRRSARQLQEVRQQHSRGSGSISWGETPAWPS